MTHRTLPIALIAVLFFAVTGCTFTLRIELDAHQPVFTQTPQGAPVGPASVPGAPVPSD